METDTESGTAEPSQGSHDFTSAQVEEWLEASCRKQGVEVEISETDTLAQVACLLGITPDEEQAA